MTEWFEQWFGEEYHALYPHRDADDARRAVSLVGRLGLWRRGDLVLDLACGNGRHAAQLRGEGARVVGYDLSSVMLRRARLQGGGWLVRGDMRALPFAAARFALALNLFTSFGYFLDDSEHAQVMREVAAVLAPGGTFLIDFLNAPQVRALIGAGAEERLPGPPAALVRRRLSADGRYVIKEIELVHEGRSFQERVRLFDAEDLRRLIGGAELTVVQEFGDYDGGALRSDSPRVILVARRA